MRTVEFLNTVVEGAGSLGKIQFDPFLAALASLKTTDGKQLITNWINPEPEMAIVDGDVFKVRDAANASVFTGLAGSASAISKTKAINGKSTFSASAATALLTGEMNPNEWTLLSVCNLNVSSSNQRVFGIGGGSLGSGVLFPTLEVYGATPTLGIREGGTTNLRVSKQMAGLTGVPTLIGGSFSLENGCTVFTKNLKDSANAANDKRPLTTPSFSFMGDRGASNPALGAFGMALVLRADITKSEYSAAREVILSGLMNRYGIS